MLDNIKRYLKLMHYSAHLVAGRKFWIVIFIPLLWPAVQAVRVMLDIGDVNLDPSGAMMFTGFPLGLVAIGLGIRLIAGEIDSRTLEIAYTVPGGCHRIWVAKIAACLAMLFVSDVLLAVFTMIFFMPVSTGTFYGAFQGAVFYMVAAMSFSAFFRSAISGAMVTVIPFAVNIMVVMGRAQLRISPFFDSAAIKNMDSSQVIAHSIQNRIFFIILIFTLTLLTFTRVERREKMLGD